MKTKIKMDNLLLFWTGLVLIDYFFPFKLDQFRFIKKKPFISTVLYFLLVGLLGFLSIFQIQEGCYVLILALIVTGLRLIEKETGHNSAGTMAGIHLLKIAGTVLVMLMSGFLQIENTDLPEVLFETKILLTILIYTFNIFPAGQFVGLATKKWRQELEPENEAKRDSLAEAGIWIGRLERVLVLTFVILKQFEAIGFLIAAKSILRFSDKSANEPRKQTEYVLIGTLISFSIALFSGLIIRAIG